MSLTKFQIRERNRKYFILRDKIISILGKELDSEQEYKTINRLLDNTKIDVEMDCWLFWGRCNPDGYGQTEYKFDGDEWRQISVHRLSAHIIHKMPIRSVEHVLHKIICPNRNCWNPEHIYVGNQSDNSHDAVTTKTHNMTRRTHCDKGHLLDGVKISSRDGLHRYCKECARDSSLFQRMRKNAKAR